MYNFQNTHKQQIFHNPSFSSTLLDNIYRSIDQTDTKTKPSNIKFYKETTINKFNTNTTQKQQLNLRHYRTQIDTISYPEHDQDILFFSSTSSSADSSSGLLSSSSETESIHRAKSRISCFAPSRPKPVKTTTVPLDSSIAKEKDIIIKSKSRALKIYNNLKKVKQPISPGGKLTSFLNSLFTNNENKTKTKTVSSYENMNVAETKTKTKTQQTSSSTCSSVSSFSRSCLIKNDSSRPKEKMCNGVKRTVRFYPVSVIVDEDNQPCGHRCLYGEEDLNLTALNVPSAWKIGRKVTKRNEKEECEINDKILRKFSMKKNEVDDDDVASCSSSDLFELDHLDVMGNERYCEDLPVFETTHVTSSTNRVLFA